MSIVSIGMNLLLAGLLVAAMVVGLRLNRRLKALRDSHEGFEAAVRELNLAAVRAEQGLADLRAATDEAVDMLSDRIEKGRALAAKLEKLVASAPELPRAAAPDRPAPRAGRGIPPVSPAPRGSASEERLMTLLSMARNRLAAEEAVRDQAAPQRAPRFEPEFDEEPAPVRAAAAPARRIMPTPDDDLFDDAPRSAAGGRR